MSCKTTVQDILHNPRLPSLPAVAIRVLELTRDANVNFREVADVIQNDQALSIKIIRTVNSSYFGLTRPCTSINQGIVYLGLKTVKTLVLGFSLVDSIDGRGEHDVGFNFASYWRRALYSAVTARELARLTGTCDPEEAFLAALIQDLGMVALHRAFGDVYLQVLDLTHGKHVELVRVERKNLKMDHAEVGARIAEMWNLPPQLVAAIRFHHDASSAPEPHAPLARIVESAFHAASVLITCEDSGLAADESLDETSSFKQLIHLWADFDEQQIQSLVSTIKAGASELAALFKINISPPYAVDDLLGEADDLRVSRAILSCRNGDLIPGEASEDPSRQGTSTCGRVLGSMVSASEFRQRLRSALAEARERDGCVGLMLCEFESPCNDGEEINQSTSLLAAQRLAEEVGEGSVLYGESPQRVTLFVPHADMLVIARLAETIRRNVSHVDDGNAGHRRCARKLRITNIGAAVYDRTTRAAIPDERKLASFAEQALELARSVGPGTVRIFNPTTIKEQAA